MSQFGQFQSSTIDRFRAARTLRKRQTEKQGVTSYRAVRVSLTRFARTFGQNPLRQAVNSLAAGAALAAQNTLQARVLPDSIVKRPIPALVAQCESGVDSAGLPAPRSNSRWRCM